MLMKVYIFTFGIKFQVFSAYVASLQPYLNLLSIAKDLEYIVFNTVLNNIF